MNRTARWYNQKRMRTGALVYFILLNLLTFTFAGNKKITILENVREQLNKEKLLNIKAGNLLIEIDSFIKKGDITNNDLVRVADQSGRFFRESGHLAPAIELFLGVTSYLEQIKNPTWEQRERLLQFYIPLGASHEELGMWNRAMKYYIKALDLAEELNIDIYKAMIYNNIGAIHYNNKSELGKAEKYLFKALEINKKLNNKKELFNNYNNLAGIYLKRNDVDQALDYALRAIQFLDSKKDAYLYYFMQANIAALYWNKKDYKLAVSYLRNALYHQEQLNFAYDLVQSYLLFAHIYKDMGISDSTRYYLNKSLLQTRKINNKHLESNLLWELSEFYGRNQDYSKAYESLVRSSFLADSISIVDNRKKMDNLEIVYDAEKKIKKNELLIKEITLKKLSADRRWIVMSFVALLLIIVVLYLINRARSREKLRRSNDLLLQQQTVLHEKEKELQLRKEQELKYMIDQKNRELTSYTLFMVKNNEFISSLGEELKQLLLELNPKDKEHREHLRQILNKLHHQNSTGNWDEFRCYFERVHPSFYENLEKYYPDLTLKEKRLCAFLRLGLSSKEISAITFKEVRSVESARNRLRKKLDLNPESNLTEFLCYNISLNTIPVLQEKNND